jgi:hypothetical protein
VSETSKGNLFGEGLAVVPRAAEDDVAVEVDGVARGDDAEHIDQPPQAPPDPFDPDRKHLQGAHGEGAVAGRGLVGEAHGAELRWRRSISGESRSSTIETTG